MYTERGEEGAGLKGAQGTYHVDQEWGGGVMGDFLTTMI